MICQSFLSIFLDDMWGRLDLVNYYSLSAARTVRGSLCYHPRLSDLIEAVHPGWDIHRN
jgi:hypothetical protein